MGFKKVKGTDWFFFSSHFSNDFINEMEWRKIRHDEFFSILKNSSIGTFATDNRVNNCYISIWFDHYVLDAKEYEMFLDKYCDIENIIDWKKDGF